MRVDEVSLGNAAPLAFHPRLTVMADLTAERRQNLADRLHATFDGEADGSVRWTDSLGEHRVVHIGAPVMPRVFVIEPADLGPDPTADRLLALLGRARQPDASGDGSLAVLLDPFAGLAIMRIWELLSITERVSERVQILMLTDDEVTVAWSTHRASTGALNLVRFWGADV